MARPKKNNADYFSHDADASNDEKIVYFEAIYGLEGYALYFKTLEILTGVEGFKIRWDEVQCATLARRFGVTVERMRAFIETATRPELEAFTIQDGLLFSPELILRLRPLVEKRAYVAARQAQITTNNRQITTDDYRVSTVETRRNSVETIFSEENAGKVASVGADKGQNEVSTDNYRVSTVEMPQSIKYKDIKYKDKEEIRISSPPNSSSLEQMTVNEQVPHPSNLNEKKRKPKRPAYVPSEDGARFAVWFREQLPTGMNLPESTITAWAKTFDELVRLDGRDPHEILKVCRWARLDSFWSSHFLSAVKLRLKDKNGIQYYDVFLNKMKNENHGTSTTTTGGYKRPIGAVRATEADISQYRNVGTYFYNGVEVPQPPGYRGKTPFGIPGQSPPAKDGWLVRE